MSDRTARELDRGGTALRPTILTKRIGPSGVSYALREYRLRASGTVAPTRYSVTETRLVASRLKRETRRLLRRDRQRVARE